MKALDFSDLSVSGVTVPIGDKKYTLREPSEAAYTQWRSFQLQGARFVDGKVQMDNIGRVAESQSLLVSLCLTDAEGKAVPLNVVRAWPPYVVKALFEEAKTMGRLDEEDGAEGVRKQIAALQERLVALEGGDSPKNLPNGTPTTSG